MKKVLSSVPGRIAVALAVVIIVALVGLLAIKKPKQSKEESQMASGAATTIEEEQVALADTVDEKETAETPAETKETTDVATDESSEEITSKEIANDETVATKSKGSVSKTASTTTSLSDKPAEVVNTPAVNTQNQKSTVVTTASYNSDSSNNASEASVSGSNESSNNSESNNSSSSQGQSSTPTHEMTAKERYYSENGKLISVIDADKSEKAPTEKEVASILEERGFNKYPVTYEYAMGGEYTGTKQITGDANISRPMYQTDYISSTGELWTIFVINGVVMTNPVSYNLESSHPVQLLISESEELTSYDSDSNKYFVTVPNESTVIVKVVDRIDAETLNNITSGEIDGL